MRLRPSLSRRSFEPNLSGMGYQPSSTYRCAASLTFTRVRLLCCGRPQALNVLQPNVEVRHHDAEAVVVPPANAADAHDNARLSEVLHAALTHTVVPALHVEARGP